MTPDCLKENGGLMGGLGVTTNSHHSSPLTVLGPNGALPLPPPPSSSSGVPSMPLHPAGIIPGPGGDLNGHMNSSNISPSGGAGAPTHLSSQLSGKFRLLFCRIFFSDFLFSFSLPLLGTCLVFSLSLLGSAQVLSSKCRQRRRVASALRG